MFKSVSVKEIEEIICINIGCLGRAVTGEIEGGSRYISSPQQLWLSCGLAADQERRAVSSEQSPCGHSSDLHRAATHQRQEQELMLRVSPRTKN